MHTHTHVVCALTKNIIDDPMWRSMRLQKNRSCNHIKYNSLCLEPQKEKKVARKWFDGYKEYDAAKSISLNQLNVIYFFEKPYYRSGWRWKTPSKWLFVLAIAQFTHYNEFNQKKTWNRVSELYSLFQNNVIFYPEDVVPIRMKMFDYRDENSQWVWWINFPKVNIN